MGEEDQQQAALGKPQLRLETFNNLKTFGWALFEYIHCTVYNCTSVFKCLFFFPTFGRKISSLHEKGLTCESRPGYMGLAMLLIISYSQLHHFILLHCDQWQSQTQVSPGKILVNCSYCLWKLGCDIASQPRLLPAWVTWQF